MKELTREQKIKLIAIVQKGILPNKILHIIDTPFVLATKGRHRLNSTELTKQEFESTMMALDTIEKTVIHLDSEEVIKNLLKE